MTFSCLKIENSSLKIVSQFYTLLTWWLNRKKNIFWRFKMEFHSSKSVSMYRFVRLLGLKFVWTKCSSSSGMYVDLWNEEDSGCDERDAQKKTWLHQSISGQWPRIHAIHLLFVVFVLRTKQCSNAWNTPSCILID